MTSIEARIEDREFDDPEVRAILDRLSLEALQDRLGSPRVVTRYASAHGWDPGDGRPLLADDDPVVMQRIGICAAARVRDSIATTIFGPHAGHPGPCDWCEYPLEMLLAACAWAVWSSRYVVAEFLVWHQGEGSAVTYIRDGGRSGIYENPAWHDYWALPRRDRRYRLEQTSIGL